MKEETYTQDEDDALIPVLPTDYYTKKETYTQDEVDALIPVLPIDYYTKTETYTSDDVAALFQSYQLIITVRRRPKLKKRMMH